MSLILLKTEPDNCKCGKLSNYFDENTTETMCPECHVKKYGCDTREVPPNKLILGDMVQLSWGYARLVDVRIDLYRNIYELWYWNNDNQKWDHSDRNISNWPIVKYV